MLKADGRVIMVSGASRGIGRAVAENLLAAGFRVSAGMRKPDALPSHENLMSARYDAEDAASVEAWVVATKEKMGAIDGIVNAAGMSLKVRITDPGEDDLDAMWRVNVKGPLRLVRAAFPHLAVSGCGRVVNLGSLAGKRVGTNVGYSMSKFAVVAMTHGVRREGRDAGIRATVICTGYVATDMTAAETGIERQDMSQPEDVAELVRTVLCLPNNASVSELWVNCQFDPMF
ncbi:SDR family NAD(P)-dependent oxidoreductase [Hydrogenophaga sp.]|uniref:SDR family NAD(P)-dependent oxidoreductase n=1 Tax=Hydrogenophaga sp. TaxID=1904254 RepID=UPI002727AA0E|nr:SDR family NAD(P)-dependent oxidoreductase [Hydrogenophaga sp.]MDO9435908.1 SDR family NAD(P)-dependent oxidoreductase [Hydrogenophaga sp.]